MAISPHPLATEAGTRILRQGGTAAEAAVAIGAVLAVVMPHFCGLGGDAVWLLADRDGRSAALMGIGQAPQVLPDLPDALPMRGPGAMLTTACAVDAWDRALQLDRAEGQGGIAVPDLLAPALALARDGFAVGASQRFWLDFRRDDWPGWPGFAALFGQGGAGPLRQLQLAEMLALLARDGLRSFYDGAAARRVAQGLAQAGSPLRPADLAATRSRVAAPLSQTYRGLKLLAPPPPTQGLTTLAIMGILDRWPLPGDPAARTHLLVEAVKQAFLDRDRIADPDHVPVDPAALLAPARLDAKAAAIRADRALPWPHVTRHGDTVFFAATDAQGRCASVLQSTFFDWGSGVVVGDTGILWHNRGAGFATAPGHPNRIAPGKRPFYTLNPGIALKDGRPHLLYGTQGADGQPQTLAVLLSALIDRGLSPAEALAEPRFLLGRTFSDSRDSLKLEGSLGARAIAALQALGHDIAELPALSPIFGCAGAIRIASGGTEGAHDPRG
ncbi:gamma-glutamyltransferase (plasmid) [Paracoccus liaowanqingii]|uniref:Gamma-glutamyltransferase n=1 Tax=Paracoccus liaowanqingii TaxID=2560053 RepID=A0A4Y5ST88_9RHOB|nr:gamma-glutamyltransferase [Paracoccus liaowanqingii]